MILKYKMSKPASKQEKELRISAFLGALFWVVNQPQVYRWTGSVVKQEFIDEDNCPTPHGRVVHLVVFAVLTYLSMFRAPMKAGLKLKYTIWSTAMFFFVASPLVYGVMRLALKDKVANLRGCPTQLGLGLHALVYTGIMYGVMQLPADPQ